jgi:GR25 family glycosyltransferase involved in LPS biosynthesis
MLMYILFITLIIFILFLNFSNKNNRLNTNTKSYVLYIDKRFNYIKKIMDKLNIKPTLIKGINYNNLNKNKLVKDNLISQQWINDTNNKVKYIKEFTLSRVACHLGHINILKKFLKEKETYALIFEDDIKIENYDLINKINVIVNNIPKDAEIIYLSYCFEYCDKIKKYNKIFSKAYRPLCRHMYLVTKDGAEKIIKHTLPMFSSGDRMIGHLIQKKILNGYLVNPEYLNIQQLRLKNGNLKTTLNNTESHRLCMY